MRHDESNLSGIYLSNVLNQVAPYFDLQTSRDLSETIALQQLRGINRTPSNSLRPPRIVTDLVDILLNTSAGAYSTKQLEQDSAFVIQRLEELTTSSRSNSNLQLGDGTAERINRFLKILYQDQRSPGQNLQGILDNRLNLVIGGNREAETNERLSCYSINSPGINPANKNSQLISFYLNGIPTLEWARAVPYYDIRFISGRTATDSAGRLNAMSLFKFLEGAVQTSGNDPLLALIGANRTAGTITGARNQTGQLQTSGMELFNATVVNLNNTNDRNLRAVPVLDPTKPFLTFTGLTIEVRPTVGLFSYKTGKLNFVLHDRSRMHEIADFLKPDLYGTTEVLIEYGWKHPDGVSSNNVYATLLNSSRVKEKYGLVNTSFSMDDSGNVSFTLELAMRGGSEIHTETISTSSEETRNHALQIETLARSIGELRNRVFNRNGQATAEIRGQQILESASDYQNSSRLTPQVLQNLNQFTRALRDGAAGRNGNVGESARDLATALQRLYGQSNQREGSNPETTGVVQRLNASVASEIRGKLESLFSNGTIDPFLEGDRTLGARSTSEEAEGSSGSSRSTRRPPQREDLRALNARRAAQPVRVSSGGPSVPAVHAVELNLQNRPTNISLAKLLLSFVGVPLASTGKFDEVQFFFYPFNDSAGKANGLNIGQLAVDTNFFFREFLRYRTENLSRATNLSLRDFLSFVQSVIIDDPMNVSYGISELYKVVRNRETNQRTTQPRYDAVQFQTRLEQLLRNQTPNGEFKMPQVMCHIEALPLRVSADSTQLPTVDKTILRLHFYDRQMTSYQGQASILQGARDEVLNSVASIPNTASGGNPETLSGHQATVQAVINAAASPENGILERARTNGSDNAHPVYIIRGGPAEIKRFVSRTMPTIIYGVQGTGVVSAQLKSQQSPELSTVNLMRNYQASPLSSNGEQPGGLPLSIIPTELGMTTVGCNLFDFAQQLFIDFNTGTTADNIYGVNGVSHTINPGEFKTEIKFVPLDAYGRYTSFLERINQASVLLRHLAPTPENSAPTQRTTPSRR